MKRNSTFGCFVIASLFCSFIDNLRGSDVSIYSVTKGIYYQQTSAGSPVELTNNGYVFEADVFLTAPGNVRSAFVQAPGSTNQTLTLDDPSQLQLKDKYNTKAKLDSHYPDGTFVMTVNTVHDGNGAISLPLQGSS